MRNVTRAMLRSGPGRRLLSALGRNGLGEQLLQDLAPTARTFASFEEAWRAARAGRRFAGHDHPDAVADHVAAAEALKPSDYAVLFWLQSIAEPLKVFDFGGSVGNLYYSYQRYLETQRPLDWLVHDLPAVVSAGRALAQSRADAEALRFSESLQARPETNVLLISGAFHYWEAGAQALFDRLGTRPQHVLLNRVPVHAERPTYFTVQGRDRYAVPCVVRNREALVTEFGALGYGLVDQWPAIELSIELPLFPDWSVPHYSGFYFRAATPQDASANSTRQAVPEAPERETAAAARVTTPAKPEPAWQPPPRRPIKPPPWAPLHDPVLDTAAAARGLTRAER